MALFNNNFGANLDGVPYIIYFDDAGACWAFQVSTLLIFEIAPPGTFSVGGRQDVTIWQGKILLIVDPEKGYFSWMAGGPGAPAVQTITAPIPTIGAGGNINVGTHQWAVTFVIGSESTLGTPSIVVDVTTASRVQLENIPIGPVGTTARKLYRTEAGGTTFKLVATISNNTVTSFVDNKADGSLGATAPGFGNVNAGVHQWAVTWVDGGGAESPLGTPSIALDVGTEGNTVYVTNIAIGPTGTVSRKLYRTKANAPGVFFLVTTISNNTATIFSDTVADSGLGAQAPANAVLPGVSLIDATKVGFTLAVYAGRVWIFNNRLIVFTAPNSFTDFSIANAGGSAIMTDSDFVGPVVKALAALDVLWVFGESAANQISNVQVQPNTTTTTFSNINVLSSVGTIFPRSVLSFLRQIMYGSRYGIIQQIGVTPQRISEKLDRTYAKLDLSFPVSAALMILNEILCYGFMATYNEPDPNYFSGQRKIILIVSADGKWFIGSQGDTLTIMASVETDGKYRVFGTDGTNIFELFVQRDYPIHRLKTPLYDQGDVTAGKELIRTMLVMHFDESFAVTTTIRPKTQGKKTRPLKTTNTNKINWIGQGGAALQWIGQGHLPLNFVSKGFQLQQFYTSELGNTIGADFDFDSDPFQVLAYAFDYVIRQSWGGVS